MEKWQSPPNGITCQPWGRHNDKGVILVTMQNSSGASIDITNYGATIVAVNVPDREGKLENVVLGYPTLDGYIHDTCYLGSTIGRFSNRIGGAKFTLDDKTYYIDKNDHGNANHGGFSGFNATVFDCSISNGTVSFKMLSKDGEGGYPGNLQFQVDYSWNENNELGITYTAITDKKTIGSFTNHAYFNLSPRKGNIFDHLLSINADEILEQTKAFIPTGRILPADKIAFSQHQIRERISREGLKGINSYYILKDNNHKETIAACTLYERDLGRRLEVFTSYPGLQLYTGDFLSGQSLNCHSTFYQPFDGVCLECHHYPDSPNHTNFPSPVIIPGKVYRETIMYKFSVDV